MHQDHVLVPYYNFEVTTQFLEEGITYDKLSDADKARYEEDFIEDDYLPSFIPSEKLNKFVFNENTVDTVLQDLMERGIKGGFMQRVLCDDAYAQTVIDDFKIAEKEPHIAVSVDMMDTGIDVPECVNLVFFKKVRSKTKFWQMIGRGTRLCEGLTCMDQIDGEYTDKRRFLIFDYCGNFDFFREHKEGFESRETKTLSESIFGKRVKLISLLQESRYAEEGFSAWRTALADTCCAQVGALSTKLVSVRLRLQYVERYKQREAFDLLSEGD